MTTRFPRVLLLAAGLVLVAGPTSGQDKKATPKITELLAKKVTIEPVSQEFGDVVKMLGQKYDLPLVVDPSVGRGLEGGVAACDAADQKTVKLPRLVNVRLDTVLKIVCEQVNATYLVYPDHIKIVNALYGLYESGVLPTEPTALPGQDEMQFLPAQELQKAKPLIKRALVSAAFNKVPLHEVLDQIAESTGATIAVAKEAGPGADTAVTVRFANTPVDAAVRTLCEMAELGVIEDANVLIVTSRERATARAKAEADKRKAKVAEAGFGLGGALAGGALGPGLGGGPGGVPNPALAAEVARLKEQNEQLHTQIEELKKLLKK